MLNLAISERFRIFVVFAVDIVLNFRAVKIFMVKARGRNKGVGISQKIQVSA